tara:strand:+ start:32 stop:505 length:474 start_codon:yes stop_codon:yes gene_type:complete
MKETKKGNKLNFNNPDGSFNRDKWLDFMNTSIQSIPYFNAITGGTSKIVNQQSKKVQWAGSSCNRDNFVTRAKTVYEKWDSEEGWSLVFSPRDYIDNPTDKIEIFKVYLTFESGAEFIVVYPNGEWRFLGYWEYAQYGFKKYIPQKIQTYLKRDGLL